MPLATSPTADGTAVACSTHASAAPSPCCSPHWRCWSPRSASPVRRGPPSGSCCARATTPCAAAGYSNAGYKDAQQHELLAAVDGPQLHQLRRLPARPQRPAEQAPEPADRQCLQLGLCVPRPRRTTPGGRLGRLVGTVLLRRPATSPTSRRSSRRTRSSSRRTTGAATSGGARSPGREGCGRPVSSTCATWGRGQCSRHLPAYRPVTPTRIVDTRTSLGASGPLASGSVDEHPRERQGRPATDCRGRRRVNVTAVRPRAAGWLLAYPSGGSPAASSTLNFDAGDVVANQAVVGVGSDGRIRLKVSQTTDALVDIVGWYPPFGNLSTTTPTRILDTRYGLGARTGRLVPGGRIDLAVTGSSVVPSSGVDSVLLNVTAARPTKDGNLAVWPAAAAAPTSSSLNFSTGRSISGLVFAKVGSNGRVSIRTSAATDVVADVVGWVPVRRRLPRPAPAGYSTRAPAPGSSPAGPVDAASIVRVKVAGRGGVPSTGVRSVVLTIVGHRAATSRLSHGVHLRERSPYLVQPQLRRWPDASPTPP